MFAYKNTYYLYIENTQILNLNIIKIRNKFTVIYRNTAKAEKLEKLIKFRLKCRQKGIKFFVANYPSNSSNYLRFSTINS